MNQMNGLARQAACMSAHTHTHTLSVQLHWRGVFARPLEAQVLKSLIKYTGADTTPSASLHSCTEGLCWRFTFISLRPGSSPHPPPPHICNYTRPREAGGGSEAVTVCGVSSLLLCNIRTGYIYIVYIFCVIRTQLTFLCPARTEMFRAGGAC